MPCTCNAICDNDCGSNQLCTGHVGSCSNAFTFENIQVDDLILASHLSSLETAINAERTNTGRRFSAGDPAYCSTHTPGNVACSVNAFGSWSFGGTRSIGDPVLSDHWDDIKNANNNVVNNSGFGRSVVTDFVKQSVDDVASIIQKIHVDDLQDSINETRNACICDSHCNCDPSDCGCNGECPSDDYYYYYP